MVFGFVLKQGQHGFLSFGASDCCNLLSDFDLQHIKHGQNGLLSFAMSGFVWVVSLDLLGRKQGQQGFLAFTIASFSDVFFGLDLQHGQHVFFVSVESFTVSVFDFVDLQLSKQGQQGFLILFLLANSSVGFGLNLEHQGQHEYFPFVG